jgi:hypothetical protein
MDCSDFGRRFGYAFGDMLSLDAHYREHGVTQ